MTNIKNIIRKARMDKGLTMKEVAIACGVSEATVSRWESGEIGDMKRSRIASLANILEISPSLIVGIDDLIESNPFQFQDIDTITIPLYESISCGSGGFVDDNKLEDVTVVSNGLSAPASNYFAQYADGDSMINAGIDKGDLLIFEKSSTIENNQIGCFCLDDNVAICKKFLKSDSFIQLIPLNNKYNPIVVDITQQNFRVVGILKMCIKRFD